MSELEDLIRRGGRLLERLEALLPDPSREPDWSAPALRWHSGRGGSGLLGGRLEPIHEPQRIALDDLLHVERQKTVLDQNTRQFLAGLPANNALLWGSRGTGKSSLIKALLTEHAKDGLRLVEIERTDLVDLPTILGRLGSRPERFLIFSDDLSFEAGDPSYKVLKALLDGSLAGPPDNVLIYATSNRRHLLPEFAAENLEARQVDGEIHHGEGVEEKISLSERFGIWLSFYPFKQEEYLRIVGHWIDVLGGSGIGDPESMRREALQFALQRGSRSGRVARQFAADWVGRRRLAELPPG
ncbi:MAG: ATP-binding protein [Chromatiales bacterium]|jgi:hypothetical protein